MFKIVKNLLKISLAPLAILISGQSQAMDRSVKDKYWYNNFREQMPLATVIEKHKVSPRNGREKINKALISQNLRAIRAHVWELQTVPPIIIKGECDGTLGAERIIGSLCINQCAAALNLDVVKSPIKLVYVDKNGKPWAAMEKVNRSKNPFSLKQMKQIYTIVKRTGYYTDISEGNIINTDEGIAYFIDTERSAFLEDDYSPLMELAAIRDLQFWLSSDDQSKQWLEQKVKKREARMYHRESKS